MVPHHLEAKDGQGIILGHHPLEQHLVLKQLLGSANAEGPTTLLSPLHCYYFHLNTTAQHLQLGPLCFHHEIAVLSAPNSTGKKANNSDSSLLFQTDTPLPPLTSAVRADD